MKLPDTLPNFILWLIEHPDLESDSWKLDAPDKLLLGAVCEFAEDFHKSNGDKMNHWDGKYHSECRMAIGRTVETGGVSGGSCWDSSNPTAYSENYVLPDISKFVESVILYFFEDISLKKYLQAKSIYRHSDFQKYEYYGNRTDYRSAYIYVDELYRMLVSFQHDTPNH